jgi:hypothetical protein
LGGTDETVTERFRCRCNNGEVEFKLHEDGECFKLTVEDAVESCLISLSLSELLL